MQTDYAPELAQRRTPLGLPPGAMIRNAGDYDAGSTATRRSVGWHAPTSSPNAGVLSSLTTLRDRSRSAKRNDGYAKGVIDKLATEAIGTGIKPLSQAPMTPLVPHPVTREMVPLRHALQAAWLLWSDKCDADGRCDFYGLQRLVTEATYEGGEVFSRLRYRRMSDGLTVPLQVQVLEPELCPHTHNVFSGDTRIRAGIQFNRIGQRSAYWFHPSRPEFDDFDRSELRPVPAETVQHVYDLLRPGQLRGVPHLTAVLITLRELYKFADATTVRQTLANMFVAFVKKEQGRGDNATDHPFTGDAVETVDGAPLLPMEPGMTQELHPGESVVFSSPPGATGFTDFMRQQLLMVSAGTGVPYEVLTGDMRGVSDRTMRVVLDLFRRRIQMWQHQVMVFLFNRPIWSAWMDLVFESGAVAIPNDYLTNPERYRAVKWIPQGHPYMHPVQDVQASKLAVRAGFTSRSAVVSEQGEDAEVIDAEQLVDNERADASGLMHDSDGRRPDKGGGKSANAGAADDDDDDDEPRRRPNQQQAHEGLR
jgi:lambda family phage portal protein